MAAGGSRCVVGPLVRTLTSRPRELAAARRGRDVRQRAPSRCGRPGSPRRQEPDPARLSLPRRARRQQDHPVRDGHRCVLRSDAARALCVVEPHHVLLESLAPIGVQPDDVDVVVLSHLHFDHAGGVSPNGSKARRRSSCSRARSTSSVPRRAARGRTACARQGVVHPRLTNLLANTGRLELAASEHAAALGGGVSLPPQLGPHARPLADRDRHARRAGVFAADLIPGRPWVHLPITMGYDRFPELLVDEKNTLPQRPPRAQRSAVLHPRSRDRDSRVAEEREGKFHAVEDVPSSGTSRANNANDAGREPAVPGDGKRRVTGWPHRLAAGRLAQRPMKPPWRRVSPARYAPWNTPSQRRDRFSLARSSPLA